VNRRSLSCSSARKRLGRAFSSACVEEADDHLPFTVLRANAAISVVLCHTHYLMVARGDSWLWNIFARAGLVGVMLLFAISGYLMGQLALGATGSDLWRTGSFASLRQLSLRRSGESMDPSPTARIGSPMKNALLRLCSNILPVENNSEPLHGKGQSNSTAADSVFTQISL
jgi:hypothetical protein